MASTPIIAPIQALRAFAAFAVCTAHLSRELSVKVNGLMPEAMSDLSIGQFGVDVFFVISGFIMVYTSENLFGRAGAMWTFAIRRIRRIVPLYWFAYSILLVWVFVTYGGPAALGWPVHSLVADYLFFPTTKPGGPSAAPYLGVGWTLFCEMEFYFVFACFLAASRSVAVFATAATLIAFIVVGLLFELPEPFAYWSTPNLIEFVFGMMIAVLFRHGARLNGASAIVLAGIGVAGVIAATHYLPHLWPHRAISLGVPTALIVAAVILGPQPKSTAGVVWQQLLFWGEASYAFYLMHPFAMTLPRHLTQGRWDLAAHPVVFVVAMIACAFLVAGVTHVCIERPIMRAWKH